jgi:PAS domain S-box-containing protein
MKKRSLILNLDDNAPARNVKSRALRSAGFEVIEAGSGAEALALAREASPDLALLDVKLRDMSSLEVCRILKFEPLTSDIPVVQISAAHVTADDEAAGLEHGADIYLTEPVEPIALIAVVRTLLRLRRTESGLLVSEERFKAIVNQASVGIVQAGLDGRFQHVNQHFCEIVGRPAQRLLEMGLFDITHPDDIVRKRLLFNRLVEEGVPFVIDKRYLRPDGAVIWTHNSISLVRDRHGIAQHAIAIVLDITERKRTQEREHFLAEVSDRLAELTDHGSMLQKITAAVVPRMADWCVVDLTGSDGRSARMADSRTAKMENAVSFAGEHPGPAILQPVLQSGQPELIEDVAATLASAGPAGDSRLRALHESGLKSLIRVPLLSRDRIIGALAMGMGASGRRYQNTDMIVAAELGRRVAIAVENVNLYDALGEEARRKDEFLATLAHELRNPLAPLRNSLLVMRTATGNAELVEHARDVMERQVAQLRRLVDDLLDVSRISTGKMELRKSRVVLTAVVHSALEATREAIEADHTLVVSLPPREIVLEADAARLAQVITNLLDNAAKFTPAGGTISLGAQQRGGEILITVADTGIGIAGSSLQTIFDVFVQGDNSFERRHSGLGIGLSLVKRLVEMHGGSVSADSGGPGLGSTFTLRLPLAVAARQHPRAAPAVAAGQRAPDSARRLVMVVDDNQDSARSLGTLLELMGHEVRIAHDGAAAVETLSQDPTEIVFLDIGMPGMNGYEVARRVRQSENGKKRALVIALSGYGTAQDVERSREAGFDMHIVKPVGIDDLNRILATAPH